PAMRKAVFAGVRKKVGKPTGPKDIGTYKPAYKGPPPRAGTKTLPGNAVAIPEDRSEAEGRASRVSKTKNREKAKKAL
ncbi:hypothetical protein ABK046_52220, partial [Streptomyces caeruleatus]